MTFEIAGHELPPMTDLDAAFGAKGSAYPPMESFGRDYQLGHAKGCKVFSDLFFKGGSLADHGIRLKPDVDKGKFYTTLRALMTSFDPKHEVKEATCGLFIDTYTEAKP